MGPQKTNKETLTPYGIYFLTLFVFALGCFIKEGRLWGINIFAFVPDGYQIIPWLIFIIAPLIIFIISRQIKYENPTDSHNAKGYLIAIWSVILLLSVLFYYFKAQTHYGGDGYQILSLMADDDPLIKFSERGEAYLHLLTMKLFGGGDGSVLLSYQLLSIFSGVLFLGMVTLFSFRLFEDNLKRLLFLLLLSSGGYMLLYFGHVENYSILSFFFALTVMFTIPAANNKISSLVLIPLVVMAIFLHVIAIVLLPVLFYLWLSKIEKVKVFFDNKKVRYLSLTATALIFAVLFFYLRSSDYFFRLAILPLITDRFTVNGYTIFSLKHLGDILNLLLMMSPGIILYVYFFIFNNGFTRIKKEEKTVFVILLTSVFGALLLIDPKISLSRDWDLFAFVFFPVIIYGSYFMLTYISNLKKTVTISLLIIMLGFTVLGSRLVIVNDEEQALQYTRSFIELDTFRNKSTLFLVRQYYEKKADSTELNRIRKLWADYYPEEINLMQGNQMLGRKMYQQAITYFRQAIDHNPQFELANSNLALSFHELGMFDSSIFYLEIADGLQPNNPVVIHNLGVIYQKANEMDKAEKAWLKAVSLHDDFAQPKVYLSKYYKSINDSLLSQKYLLKAAACSDVSLEIVKVALEHYIRRNNWGEASNMLHKADSLGLSYLMYERLIKNYPLLNTDISN